MPGPLHGVKIVDMTAVLLGPFATQHLADMGADVIKVEPPEGDLLRVSGKGRSPDMGPIYMAAGRNKRSICLDLKKPAALAVVKKMIETADIFIHNSRPQAIERLGLGYEDLKKINPKIIYAYCLATRPGLAWPQARLRRFVGRHGGVAAGVPTASGRNSCPA